MSAAADMEVGSGTDDPRRAARLQAVQALYQLEMSGGEPAGVVGEFLTHRQADAGLDAAAAALFEDLVQGVSANHASLDALVGEVLKEGWRVGRLEVVLKAILRCGAYELRDRPAVPRATVIDEYVSLAHGFFGGKEPGLVNGVLEELAGRLRVANDAATALKDENDDGEGAG